MRVGKQGTKMMKMKGLLFKRKHKFKKMAVSSYDQLLQQVESLKAENSHLRQELQDNSSHLTKLECEASNMKDVLTHIQTSMQEEETNQDASISAANVPDSRDQNSNSELPAEMSANGVQLRPKTPQSPFSSRSSASTSTGSYHSGSSGRSTPRSKLSLEILARLHELDNERLLILRDVEAEEKEKEWYYTQMQSLTQKIDSLPITETYSLQNDMTRRQLEYEAKQLREAMQQRLGAIADMQARYETRIHRVRLLEKEMLRLQQHYDEMGREGRGEDQDDRRDSGSCDLFERNANEGESRPQIQHVDHGVNTSDINTRQGPIVRGRDSGFLSDTDGKDRNHHHHNTVVTTVNGTRMVTIATQTSDVYATNSGNPYAHLSADNGSMPTPNVNVPQSMYHGAWPIDRSSTPVRLSSDHQETASMVEMVYSLLSMLGTHDKDDMSRTLLAMSSSQDSCIAMRQSGCLPLLIQLLHGPEKDSLLGDTRGSKEARARAAAALHNIVHSHPDEKRGRQEARVLRLLEQIRAYCDSLRDGDGQQDGKTEANGPRQSTIDHHPGPAVAALMKLSFDEEHRSAMCQLGGLQAIAELLQLDYEINSNSSDQYSNTLRRYAGMALTNLTFGDGANKALLCSLKGCMQALVAQLKSDSEDLRQVVASVLRNLSWRADLQSKNILREVGSVTALMESAVQVKKESTLKSILSALWNLSAHCTENKADICKVEGALAFLVETLNYKSPSRTLTVVENAGGILRNVSSHIATREDYRQILRDHSCLQVLLGHLASPSLTIVSNACGTLWNLSARNAQDQEALWEMGAVSMLRNLVNSKHKMIAMGSSAALRNLMTARPELMKRDLHQKDGMPSLHVRKQRALEADIEKNLQENNPDLDKLHQRDANGKREIDMKDLARIPSLPRRLSLRVKQRMFQAGSGPAQGTDLARAQDNRHRSRSPRGHSPANRMPSQVLDNRLLHPRDGSPVVDKQQEDKDNKTKLETMERGKEMDNNKESLEKTRDSKSKVNKSRITKVMQEVAIHAGIKSQNNIESEKREEKEPLASDNTAVSKKSQQKKICTRSNSLTFMNSDLSNLTSRSNSYSFGMESQSNHMYVKRPSSESINSTTSEPLGAHTRLPYHRPPIDHSFSVDSTLNALSKHPDKHYGYQSAAQNASHDMEGDMDTTIDYALKYSDESITARRQIPARAEGFRHEHTKKQDFRNNPSRENYLNVSGHYDRMLRSDTPNKYRHTFNQTQMQNTEQEDYNMQYSEENIQGKPTSDYTVQCQDCKMPHRHRESMASGHMYCDSNVYPQQYRPPVNEPYHKADFDAGRPTNFSAQYSESNGSYEDPHDFASDDQPTDYSQKYATDLPNSFESEHMPPDDSAMQPAEPAESSEPSDQVDGRKKPHEDKPTNYCVEDTPVCFSRCSSLSSLCSNEAEESSAPAEQPAPADNDQHATVDVEIEGADKSSGTIEDENQSVSIGEASGSGTYTPDTVDHHSDKDRKEGQGEEVFIEETPLVFSRCSSVSSLSSFELHSLHDDRSSVYSSHRASEVVSPSDLPDSPSEPMPPPSKRSSQNPSKENKEQTISEEPVTSPPKPSEDGIFQFCTEGTPMGFSGATSLSSLSFEGEEKIPMDPDLKAKQNDSTTATVGTDLNNSRQEITEVDLSGETTEAEQSILEDCIYSAMPPKKLTSPKTKVRSKMQKSPSTPHTTKHVSFSKQVFSHDAPQTFCTEDTPLNFSTATSLSDLSIDDIDIKQGDDGKMSIGNPTDLKEETQDDPKSETSSILNENDSNILAECINSAMPKPKANKPKGFHLGKRKSQKPGQKSAIKRVSPGSQPTQVIPQPSKSQDSATMKPPTSGGAPSSTTSVAKPWTTGTPPDTMTTYCTEGTPLNFSTATSLSDLTIDSPHNEDVVNGNAESSGGVSGRENSGQEQRQKLTAGMSVQGPSSSGLSPFDSPHAFNVEGTPVCFSRNDSLSSLSCDDDVDLSNEKSLLKNDLKAKKDLSGNVGVSKKLEKPAAKLMMKNFRKTPTGVKRVNQGKKATQQSAGNDDSSDQHHTQDSYIPGRISDEIPHKFAVEGTPVCFSRNSSLSSLSDIEGPSDLKEQVTEPTPVRKQEAVPRGKGKESPRNFAVEDTPVCFSRNSSLSSLSMESLNFEPSPDEQALLNDVINAAMPKKKANQKPNKGSKLPPRQVVTRKGSQQGASATEPETVTKEQSPKEEVKANSWRKVERLSLGEDQNESAATLQSPQETQADSEKPVRRGPRIMKPGESRAVIKQEESEPEPKGIKGGKKVYRSPYSQNNRSSSVPRSTTVTAKTVTPAGQGISPAGRGIPPAGRGTSSAGRGSSPVGRGSSPAARGTAAGSRVPQQNKTAVAGRGTGRGRARSAPATRTSTPTPGSRSNSPPATAKSAGTTPKSVTPPRTVSPAPKSGIPTAKTATAGFTSKTSAANTRTTNSTATSRPSAGRSAIPRTASPANKSATQSPAGRPPTATKTADTTTAKTSSASMRTTTTRSNTSAVTKPAKTNIPSRTTSPATRTTATPTSRMTSPATRGKNPARTASPATNTNRSGTSSAAASRSGSPATGNARSTGAKPSPNTSRQSSLSRASSKDSVSSSVASRSPRSSISAPSPRTMSPATQRKQATGRTGTPTGRNTQARSGNQTKQNTAGARQGQQGGSRIGKPVSKLPIKGANAPATSKAVDQLPPKPKLVKQTTFTKDSPSKAAMQAAAENAAAAAAAKAADDAAKNCEENVAEEKSNTQRVSPWRRPSPDEPQPPEITSPQGKSNPWKKTREVESPETEILSPSSFGSNSKKDSGSESGSSHSSPKKENKWKRHVSKNEYDIPVINYGGHISSPASDTSVDDVWIKREDCPINSPTASRPSSIRTGSSASSPSGSIQRIISPISPISNRSVGSSIQSITSAEATPDQQRSRESIHKPGDHNRQRQSQSGRDKESLRNRPKSKHSKSETERSNSDVSSPSPTRRQSPRGSPKKNKKKSKNAFGSGSCGVAQRSDSEDFGALADELAEGIMGIEMEPEPELVSNSDLDDDDEEEAEEQQEDDFNFEEFENDEDEQILTEPEPVFDDAAPPTPPRETRQCKFENRLNSFILINDNEEGESISEQKDQNSPTKKVSSSWQRKGSKDSTVEPESPRLQKMPATRKPPLSNEKSATQTVKPVMVSPFNYSGPLPSKSQQQNSSPSFQQSSQPPSRPMSPEGTPRRTMIPRPVGFRGGRQPTSNSNLKGGDNTQEETNQNSNSRSYLVTSV
ncbi:adenomatous polyposis coli protein-like isoform X3 [Ptychodera flava]|uniref:adenomatous polyposis coli protein-like isoform X3 n=2 Tax=Ptychodera flava TaxID=63121 RepID=UPI00396A7E8B